MRKSLGSILARLLLATLFLVGTHSAITAEVVGAVTVFISSETSAVISWNTDVQTGTRVSYGLAADQLNANVEGGVTAAHEVKLTGLKRGVTYFFAVGTARKKLAAGQFSTSGSPNAVVSPPSSSPATSKPAKSPLAKLFALKPQVPPTRETWGNIGSLPDHFERHGADFHAKDADDYARMAWQFGEQAKAGAFQVKLDEDGTRRVYDPRSGAFAAYNRDGTTKTYFKPNSRDYFARQPGRLVNPRTP